MIEPKCEECKHFHQHYVPLGNQYIKAGYGHCTSRRVRQCKPDKRVCEDFVKKDKVEQ